ncbi:YdeI/OmpD-associated family protein [Lacisediminihabitans changchengi]|uniref:DUF1905 domain-containing protein n=1 Tax=Lacisediminihabitans changchengi TaxID=2787634 RepID=A0A934SJV1_9MICO|nr:YdeI/OmpD-associated family protein [Lacisediminihabitans changchengi]MBK4346646.1 DUF1905 domain-containing protein [Lacisediminihabitans changchengi]
MSVTFTTTVLQAPGLQATGLPVPDQVVTDLGGSKKPAVTVAIGDYSYASTVGSRGGGYLIPLSAAHRAALNLSTGDEVEVTLHLDLTPRTVEIPDDLATALAQVNGARAAFDALSASRQKAHVTSVEGTKNPDTRARRVAAVVRQVVAPS